MILAATVERAKKRVIVSRYGGATKMQRIPQPLGLITLERAGFPETLRAGRNDDEMEACVYDAAVIG